MPRITEAWGGNRQTNGTAWMELYYTIDVGTYANDFTAFTALGMRAAASETAAIPATMMVFFLMIWILFIGCFLQFLKWLRQESRGTKTAPEAEMPVTLSAAPACGAV